MILHFRPRPLGPPRLPLPAAGPLKPLDHRQGFVHPSGMETGELISTAEVCRRYGVTRQTVRHWVATGLPLAPETPAPGGGGRPAFLLFRAADVAAFLEARKARPPAKRGPDKGPRQPGRWPGKDASKGAAA